MDVTASYAFGQVGPARMVYFAWGNCCSSEDRAERCAIGWEQVDRTAGLVPYLNEAVRMDSAFAWHPGQAY